MSLIVGGGLSIPTVQKFTSGSGTYTTPAGCLYIIVEMTGAGGSGSGSGTTAGVGSSNGSDGNDTTFGSSLLTAGKGLKGTAGSNGGTGGTYTVNSPAINIGSQNGSQGVAVMVTAVTGQNLQGGMGGNTPVFAGGGPGANIGTGAGYAAATNSGGGGGGALGPNVVGYSGSGGGSGAYVRALVANPAATYSYSVGASVSGGSAGTSGYAGGASGSGSIVVQEFYR